MPSFTTSQDRHIVNVSMPEIELAFSLDDGGLRVLQRVGGPNVIGYGVECPSIDVHLGAETTWLADRVFVRYLSHTIDERDDGVELVIVIGIGPLKVYDRYRITGTLLSRRVSVENVGEDEVWLRGVRLALRWARVGSLETCRFDAPGNNVRPRVSLQVAAAQRGDVLPRRFFAPGLREGRALEPAPTQGPGLMALHDPETDETLLCWYYSAVEPALPQVEGNDGAVTLLHQIPLADRLASEVALSGGTQYIMLLREPWPLVLAAFQRTWPITGLRRLDHPTPWVRDAAIYEVHPARFGGFRGLAAALPNLRALGLNTLCLMPVWEFANLKGRLWDGNWEASGNPYAIRDFESLDHTLGTDDDLRALVDAAHRQGIRVLLDLSLLGCAADARYVAEHPQWFCYDEQGRIAHVPGQELIASFDWANRGLQECMLGWALGWARAYDIDGYRVVAPRAGPSNWARPLPYHASASGLGFLRLLEQLRRELREIKPDVVLLGDLCGPLYDEVHDFALDELPHHMFVHMALNRVTPAELGEWLDDRVRALPPGVVRACFVESHRTRIINPLADGLRGSRISRMLLAGMVFCGFVPMIWSGQECAEEQFVGRLLHTRETHAALRYGAVLYNAVPCNSPQVFAILRMHESEHLLGVLNVGPHRQTVSISLPVDTLGLPEGDYALYELFGTELWSEEGRRSWRRDELLAMDLTLEPFAAYCFVVRAATVEEPAIEGREVGGQDVAHANGGNGDALHMPCDEMRADTASEQAPVCAAGRELAR